jgi:uncharacterized membrane protein
MRIRAKLLAFAAIGAMALSPGAALASTLHYQYTILDDPNAAPGQTLARGVNDSGEVVGSFSDSSGLHGFLESGGVYSTLDYPGASFTLPEGINNQGEVVGVFFDSAFGVHGFTETGGIYTPLVPSASASFVEAAGINNNGQVLGDYVDSTGGHVFIESGGAYTTIPDTLCPACTIYSGINDADQITGFTDTGLFPPEFKEGFVESGGAYAILNDPAASSFVGWTPFTAPSGINDLGQITGFFSTAHAFRGFVESGGVYTTLFDPNAPHAIPTGAGINNEGQIVGSLDDGLRTYGFVATPIAGTVPEPVTWALMLTGIAGIGGLLRRRRMSNALPLTQP